MRTMITAFAMSLLLVAAGCQNEPETTVATSENVESTAQAELSPEELGELGARIEKNPGDAQQLLAEKGLNENSFEQAVRRVSEDPEASQRYAEAYRRSNA